MPQLRRSPWAHHPQVFLFAAGVGIIGGLVGTAFQLGSYGLQHAIIGGGGLLSAAAALPWWKAVLIPFLGATVAAVLGVVFTRRRSAQGMPDVMEAITLRQAQNLRVPSTIARAVGSLALIATGGSVGREGPIVYLSASLGARFSRLSRLPPNRLGLFAGCGIAAGMASAYYAPFGAALFTMEVALANFAPELLAPVVLASVVSSLVVQGLSADWLLGDFIAGPPLYEISETFTVHHAGEYLVYLVLGVAAAFAAALFVRALQGAERFFQRFPGGPLVTLPIAGLMLGILGVWLPHVWGNGYDAVNIVLKDTPLLGFVVLLFFLKIFATAITVGSGGSGGIFTPTMFIGAALGLVFGTGAEMLLPHWVEAPGGYSVVGMAAVLSATTHAPIMAIMLLFEMTRETQILMPMMCAALAATVTSRAIGVESVYLSPLRQRGVQIPEGIEETALTTTRLRDVMRAEATWIRETATFDMIVGMVQKTRRDAIYVVGAAQQLLGVIRLHDIKNYLADEELGAAIIAADLSAEVPRLHPDQTLAEVLDYFDDAETHELPLVDRASGMLVGVVERRDVITALSVEVLQSRSLRAKFVDHAGAQHYVQMPPGHALARIPLPARYAGRCFGDVGFRDETGLTVLTVVRGGGGREQRLQPEPQLELVDGDALIVMGLEADIRRWSGD